MIDFPFMLYIELPFVVFSFHAWDSPILFQLMEIPLFNPGHQLRSLFLAAQATEVWDF